MVTRTGRAGRQALVVGLIALLSACGGGGGGAPDGGSSPPTQAGAQPGADYFPLSVGDRWFYTEGQGIATTVRVTGTQSVGGVSALVVRTQDSSGTSDDYYVRDAAGVRVLPGAGADAITAALGSVQILKLPLVSGDRWTLIDQTLTTVDLDGDGRPETITLRAQATVVGYETLSVEGTSYSAVAHVQTVLNQSVRIASSGQTLTGTTTSDDWYAPNVGLVRSRLSSSGSGQTASTSDSRVVAWRAGAQRSDATPPTLTSRAPEAGAVVGGCCTTLSLRFSKPMDTEAGAQPVVQLTGPDGQPVSGNLYWAADGMSVSFAPQSSLRSGSYSARVTTAAQDRLGNALAAESVWQFVVDVSGPAATPVQPLADAPEVPLDSTVVFTLDEDPDPASVNTSSVQLSDGSNFVPAQVSLAGRTITLTPSQPLKTGQRYSLLIYGIKDKLGNVTSAGWSFTADPGRYAAPVLLTPGLDITAAAIADIDGDGRTDILLASGYNFGSADDFKLLQMSRQADGRWVRQRRYDTVAGYGSQITSLIAADLDGSGRLAVIYSASGSAIQVMRRQPDGSLANSQTLSTAASYVVKVADINGDGRPDLIGRPFLGTQVLIWLQGSDGRFGSPQAVDLESNGFGDLAVGDLNGDGRPDLVSVGTEAWPGHDIGIALQQADGSFAPARYIARPSGDSVQGVAVGDVSGDGRADLVLTLTPSGQVGVMAQTAQGALADMVRVTAASNASRVMLADLDGDGRLDVLSSAWGGYPVVLNRQRSDGSLGGPERFPASLYGTDSPGLVAVGDADDDGRPDIVYGGALLRQRAVPSTPPPAPQQAGPGRAGRLNLGPALRATGR